MKRASLFPRLLVAVLLLLPAAAQADPPAGFAERVESLRQQFGVPGMTVAIVENGETVMAQGFGVTRADGGRRVDADTNFSTGSTGKAFTAAALAVLVDQGRLDWDDRVIDHMPDFRMWDSWVTREMTVRDLLVHRSGLGLGAGDLLFVPRSDLSRAETVRRLRHIRPATSFRSGYAYDNVLYVAAGQLIEEVSGLSWEEFMLRNVLRPAGMNRVTVDEAGRRASRNYAWPHARLNGPIRGLGDLEPLGPQWHIPANAAPAGGLTVSANDMSRWLALQLAAGDLPGEARLFSEAQSREMWRPTVLMPVSPLPEPLRATQPLFSTYALGWNVRDYRGARLISHGGGVWGSIAMVVLIPDRNVGFYIALNNEESALLSGLTYDLIDHYLGAPANDWPSKFRDFLQARLQGAVAAVQAPAAQPARVGPTLPLAGYVGDYRDPWFGTIRIREADGRLQVEWPHWPGLTATLDHWQYDTFRTRFSDPGVEPAAVTFQLGADGRVARITMQPVSPVADFSYDYRDLEFAPVATAER
jgi:CubicO group peptidase (beta-lactamase class C family)